MTDKYYGFGLPIDISTTGPDIDRMIILIHALMAVLFIGWLFFLIYLIIRFRARPGHKAQYKVNHFKAPTYLEVVIAVIEIVLLAAFSYPAWHRMKTELPDPAKALHVRIVAEQFAWNIHYPGEDGVFGKTDPKLMSPTNPVGLDTSDTFAKDDIAAINQLHIPVDTPVIAQLSSKDVIHSFSIPVMRVKQDMVPGQKMFIWFQAKQTGDFEIACAQLCGLGHYRMRGFFIVDTADKFKQWLDEQAPKPSLPEIKEAVV